jgi:DNA-binding transcriptional MerR regulator
MGQSRYSVKQLARLAGVSVRTLHVYDKLGLLRPSVRTDAGYRQYGEAELLRLQQILFYKELDMPLKDIAEILDDPEFDLLKALTGHKAALSARRDRINTLLNTIDATIDHLKNKTMSNFEELYEGMPLEQAAALREEAIDNWGEEAIKARAYKGLGELYTSDERYTAASGKPDPEFAAFMRAAMNYYAEKELI